MKIISRIIPALILLLASCKGTANYSTWVVSTLAGNGGWGFADGIGTAARFDYPLGVVMDSRGYIYVADEMNHCIREITPAGVVSTFAGSGAAVYRGGQGRSARFDRLTDVAVYEEPGSDTVIVYVADRGNHCIRKIDSAEEVSAFAGSDTKQSGFEDGQGSTARFYRPSGVAVDSSGDTYVAELINHRIRKITPTGVVSTLAGSGAGGLKDGVGSEARFTAPPALQWTHQALSMWQIAGTTASEG